ncbi:hypothetical protein [Streptomyces luteolus]|uniref:Uncharacterized protein n=1 Tax=Streptomyces luteolus TaxID=3043615 RepID=A0ABT6SX59_9ACTN|nr:hypothetical protein [Streptomyces sp. B-S-A12]MDI3420179.1 hypothetical protein [Streptomyces sp. B-S-A12]
MLGILIVVVAFTLAVLGAGVVWAIALRNRRQATPPAVQPGWTPGPQMGQAAQPPHQQHYPAMPGGQAPMQQAQPGQAPMGQPPYPAAPGQAPAPGPYTQNPQTPQGQAPGPYGQNPQAPNPYGQQPPYQGQ